jgi:serine/threonine protein kinase
MSSITTAFQLEKNAEPIPGYILQERIGVGGYGEVWKATAPGGLTKAIKFVHGRAEDKWAERELSSLELVKTLSHPFLLSLERIEVIEGHLVIVSEMADSSLKERFTTYQRAGEAGIPREELIEYLCEAAEALDYLSESWSLQHLDVKPENILLVGRHVKLADFGLVKNLNEAKFASPTCMTPKYAAPELFDRQPSRYSDQYSLALVYCEMATGQFPFTGCTPAVLASQHLHGTPKLDALTTAERVTVEKALSKEPEHRFQSCSELMSRLRRRDTTSALIGVGEKAAPPRKASQGSSLSFSLAAMEGDDAQADHHHDNHTITFTSGMTRSLPAIELGGKTAFHRPSVFIGIGGTGGRVLCRLRELLSERFGERCVLPSLQFLWIDTDSRSIEAADERQGQGLRSENTLFLPLRAGWDYRKMPLGEYGSISRRWLYNIPRSRRTEGIRAFGRIALLDHADAVLHSLRTAVSNAASSEAAKITTEKTRLPFRDGDPRIFLVASIGGGTGSGMLIDVSYAVRQVLAEAGLCDEDLCGIFTYTTARGQTPPCLETGNAYSCLEELSYFSSPQNDYPGERASGLLGFREGRAALQHTYLLEMDGLGRNDAYGEQVDRLAKYLFLNSVSSAAAFFDACRALERKQSGEGRFSMRTVGLQSLAWDSSRIEPQWIEEICRSLIHRWRGTAAASVPDPSLTTGDRKHRDPLPANGPDAAGTFPARKGQSALLDKLAWEQARILGLEPEQVTAEIESAVSASLGRDVREYVNEMVRAVERECQARGARMELTPPAVLATVDRFLGIDKHPDADADTAGGHDGDSLRSTAGSEAKRLADAAKGTLFNGLFRLAEEGHGRVVGASGIAERLLHLIETSRDETGQRLQAVQGKRKDLADELVRQNRWCDKWRGRGDRLFSRLGEYGTLVLAEIICEAAQRMVSRLHSSAKLCQEKLHELSRILEQSAETLEVGPAAESVDNIAGMSEEPAALCADPASTVFAEHFEEMVEELDRQIQSCFFSAERRLTGLLTANGSECQELIALMRNRAKTIVIHCLETSSLLQLGAVLNEGGNRQVTPQLENLLKAVTPALLSMGGGARRLVLLAPDDATGEKLREKLELLAGEKITLVKTSEGEVVLCCEAEDIGFESFAAQLMTSQPECKELASRLHTRVDVRW